MIKNKPPSVPMTWEMRRLRRKADQEWDLAGLARGDNDMEASIQHTANARRYEAELGELIRQ